MIFIGNTEGEDFLIFKVKISTLTFEFVFQSRNGRLFQSRAGRATQRNYFEIDFDVDFEKKSKSPDIFFKSQSQSRKKQLTHTVYLSEFVR